MTLAKKEEERERLLEKSVQGSVHHSDALSLQNGGHDTSLVEQVASQMRGSTFVETVSALLNDVDHLPDDALPASQEAAVRLVRRIAARTPTPGETPTTGDQDAWWQLERHHGMGDAYSTVRSPTSRVSSDSGESHRRRRMLGIYAKTL